MIAVPISNEREFKLINGLWKGKKGPLVEACVIRNTNFGPDGRLDSSDIARLEVERRQLDTRQLQSGDIILERSGGGPKQPVGRVVFFDLENDAPFSFSNFTSAIRILDKAQFEPRFVHYYLLHFYNEGGTKSLQSNTTGIRNLNFDSYIQTEVPKPPLMEQRKIVAVLTKLQQAVEVEGDLVRVTRELKQAALGQLFTRGLQGESQKETDIGLVPESWEVVPLGSLGRIGNGSTPRRTEPDYWTGGTIPWLTSGKVYDRIVEYAAEFVTPKAVKECHLPKVPADSLVIAITGQGKTLGHVARVAIETCMNQHLAYITIERSDVVPDFVRQYLDTCYAEFRQVAQGGGSTKGALTCGFLKGFPVPLAPEAEQREIAAILRTIDNKISHHEERQRLLRELFRTLLHDLMTARRRVTEIDLAALGEGA